jgi:hypothetical protein
VRALRLSCIADVLEPLVLFQVVDTGWQVVNMLMGDMMCAFSESFALADAAGLSKDDLLDIVSKGAVAAPMYGLKVSTPPLPIP